MTVKFETQFAFGDIVYLKTDEEQKPRIVMGYYINRANDADPIIYVASGEMVTSHLEIELTHDKTY